MSHKVWCPAQSFRPVWSKSFFSEKWAAEICPTHCESFFYQYLPTKTDSAEARQRVLVLIFSDCVCFSSTFFFPFGKVGGIVVNITFLLGGMQISVLKSQICWQETVRNCCLQLLVSIVNTLKGNKVGDCSTLGWHGTLSTKTRRYSQFSLRAEEKVWELLKLDYCEILGGTLCTLESLRSDLEQWIPASTTLLPDTRSSMSEGTQRRIWKRFSTPWWTRKAAFPRRCPWGWENCRTLSSSLQNQSPIPDK